MRPINTNYYFAEVNCRLKIIVISGHAQNGKDTVAQMIRKELEDTGERVLVTHYADLVKYICRTFFGWNGEKDEFGRSLLQYVGTDVVRKADPDYWVRFIAGILKFFPDNWGYVLIPDARFPNEIRSLQEEGFDVVHLRVRRENFVSSLTNEQQQHPSETALDHTEPDHWIINDGSLEHLETIVRTFVKENIYE